MTAQSYSRDANEVAKPEQRPAVAVGDTVIETLMSGECLGLADGATSMLNSAEARRNARQQGWKRIGGWKRVGGQDVCPLCLPLLGASSSQEGR